jgi:hypothetical protein
MSGYNKVMSLYDPDSDDDSSDEGMLICGRRESMSSAGSVLDALTERFKIDEYDEDTHLRSSAYNPSNLHIGVGTAVNMDGDSDDDGQSMGDDPAYKPLTIGVKDNMGGGKDLDEQSIGSDDDFVPAVHSTFPKHKGGDITNQMSAYDGREGGDEVEVPEFAEPVRVNEPPARGGGGGGAGRGAGRRPSTGGKEDDGGRGGGGGAGLRIRAPQPEVVSALAKARKDGAGGVKAKQEVASKKMKEDLVAVRKQKGEQFQMGKEDARATAIETAERDNVIPNTRFSYTNIKVAGKTLKQINHDEFGVLDGKVAKLPMIERAIAEAEDIADKTPKVKQLLTKLKALKKKIEHDKRKAEGTARKYVKRKVEVMRTPKPASMGAGGGAEVVNVGGNISKLKV